MAGIIENRMVIESEWERHDSAYEELPRCECCEEKIKQARALHIYSGNKRVWICSRCIEDMMEATGY